MYDCSVIFTDSKFDCSLMVPQFGYQALVVVCVLLSCNFITFLFVC